MFKLKKFLRESNEPKFDGIYFRFSNKNFKLVHYFNKDGDSRYRVFTAKKIRSSLVEWIQLTFVGDEYHEQAIKAMFSDNNLWKIITENEIQN